MSTHMWPRVTAFGGSVLAAALTLVTVRSGAAGYERGLAERSATTIASFLAIAAPADRGGSDYELSQLLIQARGVVTLLGLVQLEVYHATAPLVHAVAPPLSPAELERLRREETTGWDGAEALAPLFDREAWEVVGAVSVPRRRLESPWLERGLPVLLLITLGFAGFSLRAGDRTAHQRREELVVYGAVALVVGCVAYLDVRTVAKRSTDRWLAETGALVQEAATHSPGGLDVTDLASIVRGGILVPAEVIVRDPAPRRLSRGAVGAVAVRMGGGRWADLRTEAAENATGVWLLCAIVLALLGPVGMWLAVRGGSSLSLEPPHAGTQSPS